jgi:hypothetical protein
MADMRKAFKTYYNAAMVAAVEPVTHTIRKVVREKVGDDDAWVIYFTDTEAPRFKLNSSNNDRLCADLGWSSDDWHGRRITLTTEKVRSPNGGRLVDGIVSRAAAPKRTAAAKAAVEAR